MADWRTSRVGIGVGAESAVARSTAKIVGISIAKTGAMKACCGWNDCVKGREKVWGCLDSVSGHGGRLLTFYPLVRLF